MQGQQYDSIVRSPFSRTQSILYLSNQAFIGQLAWNAGWRGSVLGLKQQTLDLQEVINSVMRVEVVPITCSCNFPSLITIVLDRSSVISRLDQSMNNSRKCEYMSQ
jgi:hypothetical protein